jgi:hypothetical protein
VEFIPLGRPVVLHATAQRTEVHAP